MTTTGTQQGKPVGSGKGLKHGARGRLGLIASVVLELLLPVVAQAQSSSAPFTSGIRYDLARRITGTIAADPDGGGNLHHAARRNTFDSDGNLVSTETGELAQWQSEDVAPASWSGFTVLSTTTYLYDGMGRKTRETLSAGGALYAVKQYSYDGLGSLVCTAARMNVAAFDSLPVDACQPGPEGSRGPDRITRNVYDAAGQVLTVQKAVGTPLQQDYATFTYSANGKQLSMTDANGNKATMVYDGFDRQTEWHFPDKTAVGTASASDYEAYAYDANGNRTSLRKRDGRVIGYSYDALNRVTVKDIPDGTTADVYYGYDLRGLPTYARFASVTGTGITNSYDQFGRLRSSTTNQGGTARTMVTKHDENGNLRRIVYPDDATFIYLNDGLDRLTGVVDDYAVSSVSIAYDAQGQRAGLQRGTAVTSYGYDPVARLANLTDDLPGTAADVTITYSYNPASQIVTKIRSNDDYAFNGYVTVNRAYATNGLNQYVNAGPASFTYDANGNLISDGTTSYSYDVENRLIATSSGVTLEWDPLGRLYRVFSPTSDKRFVYDGDQLTVEYDGNGNILRRYLHGIGEDEPLIWYEGAGLNDLRTLQADAQGSVISVANASGLLLGINTYDEYGIPGANNIGRFQYTGQAWIPELGMYHYKTRIYSPTLGRFLQTDPIGYADQNNLYAYVANDPVNNTDPSGTYSCGSSMNSAQCSTFMARQKEAIGQIKGQISAMKGLQTALQNGTKLTGAQQQLSNRLNAYVGPKAGSNPGAIGSVIKAGQSMLSGLQGNRSFQASPTANGTTYATNNRLLGGKLYPSFFAASPSMQTQIVAHESGHETPGVGDRRYTDGTGPYGDTNARAIARYGPDQSLRNADNLAFAFGFQRDDD